MRESLKIILVIYGLIVAVGCFQTGTPFSLPLYEALFAAGYEYQPVSHYVETEKHMIDIQKKGGEQDEVHADEYTSVEQAKQQQQQIRTDAMADLRNSSKEEFRMLLIGPIWE